MPVNFHIHRAPATPADSETVDGLSFQQGESFAGVTQDDGAIVAPPAFFDRLNELSADRADAQGKAKPPDTFKVMIGATEHTPAFGPFEVKTYVKGCPQYPPEYHAAMAKITAVLTEVAMREYRSGKAGPAATGATPGSGASLAGRLQEAVARLVRQQRRGV